VFKWKSKNPVHGEPEYFNNVNRPAQMMPELEDEYLSDILEQD